MLGFKKKSTILLELNDYILRALVKKGVQPSQWVVHEIPIPSGVIQDSVINDEVALYQILKEQLSKLVGKRQDVRMFVPDVSVLLKNFDCPEEIERHKLKEYVQMELGRSIHLPFREPLLDVYDPIVGDGQATLFAAPPEEIEKLVGLLLDIHLIPEAVDIRALCNLRLLTDLQKITTEKTYMVTNWSINELSISIYSNGQIEFIRYQTIDTDIKHWQLNISGEQQGEFTYQGEIENYRMTILDRVLELDRIINFFKYSLHKGEREVDEIIVMGDNPLLHKIFALIPEHLTTPIIAVDDEMIGRKYPNFGVRHASLLGLALKEVHA